MHFNRHKTENDNDGKIQTLLLQAMRQERRTVSKDVKKKKNWLRH